MENKESSYTKLICVRFKPYIVTSFPAVIIGRIFDLQPFNRFQLIGGAITPSVFSSAASNQQPQQVGISPNLMIGDYVGGNLVNVLGNSPFRQ